MLEVHVAELNGLKHTVVGLIRQDTVTLVMSKGRATKQDMSGRAVQRNLVGIAVGAWLSCGGVNIISIDLNFFPFWFLS